MSASMACRVLGSGAPSSNCGIGGALGPSAEVVPAYGQAIRVRRPLTCATAVMRIPVLAVPVGAVLGEARRVLARHGIAHAPVVGGQRPPPPPPRRRRR